jgi:chorismate mutase
MIRGVRGAITILSDSEKDIISSTETLLKEMINQFISATEYIHSAFPAKALRKLEGWRYVPVLSSARCR